MSCINSVHTVIQRGGGPHPCPAVRDERLCNLTQVHLELPPCWSVNMNAMTSASLCLAKKVLAKAQPVAEARLIAQKADAVTSL